MDVVTLLALIFGIGAIGYFFFGSSAVMSIGTGGTGRLSASQIMTFAANAGFTGDDLATAIAIALAESGGDPGAIGDQSLAPTKGPSQGLMQINVGSKAHPEWNDGQNFDPQVNMYRAYELYLGRGGAFTDWSTFLNSAYTRYLDAANQAVNA